MTIIIKQTFDIKITHGNVPNGDILTTFYFDYKFQTRELHLVNFIRSNSECDQIQPIYNDFLPIGNDAEEWGGSRTQVCHESSCNINFDIKSIYS